MATDSGEFLNTDIFDMATAYLFFTSSRTIPFLTKINGSAQW
jgi:hypothetical protein